MPTVAEEGELLRQMVCGRGDRVSHRAGVRSRSPQRDAAVVRSCTSHSGSGGAAAYGLFFEQRRLATADRQYTEERAQCAARSAAGAAAFASRCASFYGPPARRADARRACVARAAAGTARLTPAARRAAVVAAARRELQRVAALQHLCGVRAARAKRARDDSGGGESRGGGTAARAVVRAVAVCAPGAAQSGSRSRVPGADAVAVCAVACALWGGECRGGEGERGVLAACSGDLAGILRR